MKNRTKKEKIHLGSKTAKAGFNNEHDVVVRFNNWKTDVVAQAWLKEMSYNFDQIEYVRAIKVKGHYKADVQARIRVVIKLHAQEDIQNLQVKLVSNPQGFNQIDKRWTDKYSELWNIPSTITSSLKLFSGETLPRRANTKNKKRMFLNELSEREQLDIVEFFTKNRILIISDILKGRGEFSADWTLVILKLKGDFKWVLKSINHVMNTFGSGEIRITPRGSLQIGKIGMQRKGGDGGRPSANMLQFKMNPVELFD
jgi:hypothetical protein